MDKIKLIGQLKKAWIQLELAKREKTNELWIIEAQIEKIKSKIKNYGMDQDLGMDTEAKQVAIEMRKQAYIQSGQGQAKDV